MALDVAGIQESLRAEGLDGWLLYDFHGSNPIAGRITGLSGSPKMTTRRWYYLIPAQGEPRGLVHAIERHNLDELPGPKQIYASHDQLESALTAILRGVRRIAMEYSPECAIPYVSRVDAGTVEAVRKRVADIVSSGDLIQRFEACWDQRALATHLDASACLYRVKDRAFDAIAQRLRDDGATTEYDIQQLMVGWFAEEGLVSDSAPVVGAMENAGNPHYLPTPSRTRAIRANELVLLDLWAKRDTPLAVFADITWVGFTGSAIPATFVRAFHAVRDGRDAAIELVQQAARDGRELRGWEVDRACRAVLERAGYGAQILHRTGHSLGETVHGNGVHLDDYETHDTRRLLPGAGFTIEPGVYFETFGVRSEINMYVGERDATVTGPAQQELVQLA